MAYFKWRLPVSGRALLVWGIALISGVFAALAAQAHLEQKVRQLEAAASVPMVTRIVAAFDLPAGTLLDMVHLATRAYPRALVSSDTLAVEHLSLVAGQQLLVPLRAGDLIVPAHTRRTGRAPFSSQLGQGRRAITMPVDAINSVSGLLMPGDLIDLYVSFDYQRRRITAPLLQGVLVLATGLNTGGSEDTASQAAATGLGGYATVTLDTSPEDAVKLVAARQSGVITSVLRRPDDEMATRKAVRGDLASLLGVARPPPAQTTPKRAPVIYGSTGKVSVPGLSPSAPVTRYQSGVFELPAEQGLVSAWVRAPVLHERDSDAMTSPVGESGPLDDSPADTEETQNESR